MVRPLRKVFAIFKAGEMGGIAVERRSAVPPRQRLVASDPAIGCSFGGNETDASLIACCGGKGVCALRNSDDKNRP